MLVNFIVYTSFIILLLLVLYYLFWRFWFLRDPERVIPGGDDKIVCPADGRIIKIMKIDKQKLKVRKGLLGKIYTHTRDMKDPGHLISIFMSPLNVHIQRAPISGTVKSVKHTKGLFMAANTLDALNNEKNEILIDDIKVIQIAGFLARRISCFVKVGQNVRKGERIGLINLGSQVTMLLPKNINISVKEGLHVKAGETIIGTIANSPEKTRG